MMCGRRAMEAGISPYDLEMLPAGERNAAEVWAHILTCRHRKLVLKFNSLCGALKCS